MAVVQYLEVAVGDLRPNPFNPNRVSAENEKKIRASIERNGLFKPIIVREVEGVFGWEIIGGQHRWEQAVALGHTHVPVANLGRISDTRAKEIGLIDNARYGADDTMTLSAILKEIGDADEIQSFLPYGETDLTAIFSASSIDLDDLTIPEDALKSTLPDANEPPATKSTKTHTIMRFKVSNGDAERLTKLIASTQRDQGLTTADDLTNAGDALVFLLTQTSGLQAEPVQPAVELDAMLDEIETAIKES